MDIVSVKTMKYNVQRNTKFPYYYFVSIMKPQIKKKKITIPGSLLESRKLASTNKITFTVYYIEWSPPFFYARVYKLCIHLFVITDHINSINNSKTYFRPL